MDKHIAGMLGQQLQQWSEDSRSSFAIESLMLEEKAISKFHQWANGKPFQAAFRIANHNGETYFLLLIDWHRNENYYLVLYLHDKSSTAAEIHQAAEDLEGNLALRWTYHPLKRDGLNKERKAYFKQAYGSVTRQIPLPKSAPETEQFLEQLFALARNRLRVDRIAGMFTL